MFNRLVTHLQILVFILLNLFADEVPLSVVVLDAEDHISSDRYTNQSQFTCIKVDSGIRGATS